MKMILFASILSLIAVGCSKPESSKKNYNKEIESILDQVRTEQQETIQSINERFNKIKEAAESAQNILDSVHKNTVFYSNKVVRIDILNDQGNVASSYLDYLELDPNTGNLNSKFEGILFLSQTGGLCLNLTNDVCAGSTNYKKAFTNYGTILSGKYEPSSALKEQISKMPDWYYIKSTTAVLEKTNNSIMAEISQVLGDNPTSKTKIRISLIDSLSSLKHSFAHLTEDRIDRKEVSTVSDLSEKQLSSAVVQIILDNEGSSLLHGLGSSHGTGFFISNDGLMLTNHHVITGSQACANKFKCSLKLRQIDPENKEQTFEVNVEVLTLNEQMDFALIKVDIPSSMKISALPLETSEVSSELMTLGYPADKGSDRETLPLTYSFGKLTALLDLGYVTNVYIYGGASGSPLLNAKNKNVVGIISNGINSAVDEVVDGAPGIARPIQLINSKFGLSDYISGTKNERITLLMEKIKISKSAEEAEQALSLFDKENSLLGVPVLKKLMLTHQNAEVRRMILDYLSARNILLGYY